MKYLEGFTLDCPDGYIPVCRPREWTNRHGGNDPVITINSKYPPEDDIELTEIITSHINNCIPVLNACLIQLAKSPSKEFIVGLSPVAEDIIAKSINRLIRSDGTWCVDIPLSEVYIYQKLLKKTQP